MLAPIAAQLRPLVWAGEALPAAGTREGAHLLSQIDAALQPLKTLAGCGEPTFEDAEPIAAIKFVGQLDAQLRRISIANQPAEGAMYRMAVRFDPRAADSPQTGWAATLAARTAAALDRVGPERLRRCEVCRDLFLAPRSRSAACSRRCSNVLRQRVFYEREKRRIEVAAQLLAEKKDAREVARQLGVAPTKARRYIAIARKEKKGNG